MIWCEFPPMLKGYRTQEMRDFIRTKLVYDPKAGGFEGFHEDADFWPGAKRSKTQKSFKMDLVRNLVWLYHHGEWPPEPLKVANEIEWDARIENLGMVLKNGHVAGAGDEWCIRQSRKGEIVVLATYPTWQAACAAYDVGDLV